MSDPVTRRYRSIGRLSTAAAAIASGSGFGAALRVLSSEPQAAVDTVRTAPAMHART
jgi:hypothetical protein